MKSKICVPFVDTTWALRSAAGPLGVAACALANDNDRLQSDSEGSRSDSKRLRASGLDRLTKGPWHACDSG